MNTIQLYPQYSKTLELTEKYDNVEDHCSKDSFHSLVSNKNLSQKMTR